jgi:hypothetical protein
LNVRVQPTLVVLERRGRWASSLRRHGLVAGIQLVETRSLDELTEALAHLPHALAAIEIDAVTAGSRIAWIADQQFSSEATRVLAFASRAMRVWEAEIREAGALHVVTAELDLFLLAGMFGRYLSDPAFATLDGEEQSLAERVRAKMPWRT